MSDIADDAQHTQELWLSQAIAAARSTAAPMHSDIERECIDCGDLIEPERIRVLRVTSRCASCAHDHEQRMRRAR